MLEENSLGSKQGQLGKEQLDIKEEARKTKPDVKLVLNKHLVDNVIIHSDNEFIETSGPKTASAKTVTCNDNTDNDSHFIIKYESLKSTITEVIAGSLYKALLYNRSPNFTLVEGSNKKSGSHELKLKSKLLNNFITLNEFIYNRKQEKLLDLIYEKFSDKDGREELAAYLSRSYSFSVVKTFIELLNIQKEKIEGAREFIDNIIKQFHNIERSTELKSLPASKDILTQIFEKFKDKKEVISEIFTYSLNEGIKATIMNKSSLLKQYRRILNKYCDEDYQDEEFISETKAEIEELAIFYKSLNSLLERFDKEKFNKKFMAEMIEEIKNAKGIHEEMNNYTNQKLNEEVQGIEKLVATMMLLGYGDMHGSNIGIMKIGYQNNENVYAKVDMSASFYNFKYTHYSRYVDNFKYMIYPDMQHLNIKIKYNIDYDKLKKEINKACDLFINNPEYVESLIHRALFYKKPLLKTQEELNLVKDLVGQIKTQAELLREFANSEEFQFLKEYVTSECGDYKTWALDNGKEISEEMQLQITKMRPRNNDEKGIIEKITDAVEANLAKNLDHSKNYMIEDPNISCIEGNAQKTR